MNKKRIASIDYLKGIAIILVLLGHSIIQYPINLHENDVCRTLYEWICTIQMPLFFFASGFCYSYNGGGVREYVCYIKKRTVRILIPYMVFSCIDLLVRTGGAFGVVNRTYSLGDAIIRVLFYGGEYWFLYVIFILNAVFPIIDKTIYKKDSNQGNAKEVVFLIICATITTIKSWIPLINGELLFEFNQVVVQIFYFAFGYTFKKHGAIDKLKVNKRVKFLIGFAVLYGISCYFRITREWPLAAICGMTGILFFLFILVNYEKEIPIFLKNILDKTGKNTLPLYLFNGYFLVISRTIICQVTDIPVVIIAFNMLIDYILSLILILLMKRISWIKFIIGG